MHAQMYLNRIPSRSTDYAPFLLRFGVRLNIKEDQQIREILKTENAIIFQEERDQMREQAYHAILKI